MVILLTERYSGTWSIGINNDYVNEDLDVNTWEVEGSNERSTYEYLGKLPDWCKGTDVDLMNFSLDVQKLKTFHVVNVHALQGDLSSGTYLGMLPDWDEDLEGDPGALFSVHRCPGTESLQPWDPPRHAF